MLPVDDAPERALALDRPVQRLARLRPVEELGDLGLIVPRLRHGERLPVLVFERRLLPGVVEEVPAVHVRLCVVVERDPVRPAVVLREQLNRRPAAGVAVLRVVPARAVLADVVVERSQQPRLGVVARVFDRAGDEVEAAVLGRGVADVRRVLGGGVRLHELELDPRLLLPEARRSTRSAPFGNLFSNWGRAKLSAWTTSVSGAFPALRRALAARTARPSSEFAGYW